MSNEVRLILYFILLLPTPVHLGACSRALDVVFVLDAGPGIPDAEWKLMTDLSRDVAYDLHPSTYGSHVALIQFSGNTSVVHGLTDVLVTSDRSEFLQTGRNLSDAVDTTRRLVLNNMEGDRPEVPDVIVLIINGLVDDRGSAVQEATRVKSDGIRVITVGVTNTQVDQLREELREIATDPEDVESLMLINRNYYSSVRKVLKETVCRNRVEATDGNLRLVDGTSNTGRLEVYTNEEWVTVCSTGWTQVNTRVACKQLGFPDGHSMHTMNQISYYRRIGVANINCTDNDTVLLQCSHDPPFHIDASCDHRRDVFIRCLCGDCNDYIPKDNVRLADRTSISGRLEVFSPRLGWGGVCSSGWTSSNTRVACRQLGFLDEAGAYLRSDKQSTTFVLFHVNCSGNETSLFNCEYITASAESCIDPIHIRCQCINCLQLLLEAPGQKHAMTQSTAVFEWRLKTNISSFEILFLSQKNPQTLMYVDEGKVVKMNSRFEHRIHSAVYQSIHRNRAARPIEINEQFETRNTESTENNTKFLDIQLIDDHDDYATVGFNLTNITAADMGIYSLHVPTLLVDSKAILIVTDFAVGLVPDRVVRHQVHDRVTLSWDLTALRRLRDVDHDIFLTTPATGRLHLEYYYTSWLRDNPRRHVVPQPADRIQPTLVIDDVTVKDAGNYVIDVSLTSSVHQWLNHSWQYETFLAVDHGPIDATGPSQTNHVNAPLAAIVLAVLLGLSIIVIIVLLYMCRKRGTKMRELESEVSSRNEMERRQQRVRLPVSTATELDVRYEQDTDDNNSYNEANDSYSIDDDQSCEDGLPVPERRY